jgi:hypothetical protein
MTFARIRYTLTVKRFDVIDVILLVIGAPSLMLTIIGLIC